MSWSPNNELRGLLAEVLGEVASGLLEPAGLRRSHLLRLAAADAALLGYDTLSDSLRSLSARLEVPGQPVSSPVAVVRALGSVAHALTRNGDAEPKLPLLEVPDLGPETLAPENLTLAGGGPTPAAGTPSAPDARPPVPPAPVAQRDVAPPITTPIPAAAAPAPEPGPARASRVQMFFESEPPISPPAAPSVPAAAASPAPAMAAGRVLLVDPAPLNRAALSRMLRRLRWDVRELDLVQPALEAVSRGEADALIVDARRLHLQPAALLSQVWRHAGGRALPVVFLVEGSAEREEEELLRVGAVACLRRPTDEATLRRVLDVLRPAGGTA